MSAVLLAGVALLLILLGYVSYGPKVAKWLGLKHDQVTPAIEYHDGVDFVPAKHWTVLLGHHFASIAGAAPIIGPVIACLFWGWLPALLWIVLGGILLGAVHDFTALTLSVQEKGRSITTLTENALGKTAKIAFSVFVFLALILVVAVFAAVAGKTLAAQPKVVIPTFGLIIVAFLIGFAMYSLQWNLLACSILGVTMLGGLIYLGAQFPIELNFVRDTYGPEAVKKTWTIILLIYGLVASVMPVTLLLQPRDHLAAVVLFIGMFLGFLGLAITRPEMKAPAIVAFDSKLGWLWPMLFVTVACGAISGFHSLVSSGTTSKQLPTMRDARLIGYGGMLLESALSVLAVMAVAAGLYWGAAPDGCSSALVYQEASKDGNWIGAFGIGYGEITKSLLGTAGPLIGITMLKTFVMTTLDSATRITRYICSDLFGQAMKIRLLRNKYVATILVGSLAANLAIRNWSAIWPVFGSANQLIASVVFIVASVHLILRGRSCLFTAIPGFIMLITTLGAMTHMLHTFITADSPKILLAVITVTLMLLALFILTRGIIVIKRTISQRSTA